MQELKTCNAEITFPLAPMSGQAAPAQSPQSAVQAGPSQEVALPPKQRFKEAIVQSEAASNRQKRPLADVAAEGRPEENPASWDPTDRAAAASRDGADAFDDGFEAAKQAGKQPRIQPSLLRNIAPFRKPRVGLEYQALIPPLQPKPRPAQ